MGFVRTYAGVLWSVVLFAALSPVHAQPPVTAPGEAPAAAPVAATAPTVDPDAGVAEARRRYAQGAEFYRRNRYSEAVAEFTEAYRLWPNPTILFALGQAYEGLTQLVQAIQTYQLYLDTAPAEDSRRGEVQARITQLEALLATLTVETNVPAEIYIDGEPSGDAPGTVRVSTGRHVVEVRADGHTRESQTIIVAAGTQRELRFNMRPIASGTTEIIRVEQGPRGLPPPVLYTMIGVSSASFVTWGSISLVALRKGNRYNDDLDRNVLDRRAVRDWQRRSDIMLGVTGALTIGTVIIGLFTNWDSDEDEEEGPSAVPSLLPDATVDVSPTGASFQLRWSL